MASNGRRHAIRALALSAGGCSGAILARAADRGEVPRPRAAFPWPYRPLEPPAAAHRAYGLYDKGHCMYAVFAAIVGALAERHGEPYASFPLEMMAYGLGGVAGWGTLCGAVNGAAAAIALFVAGGSGRDAVTRRLLRWYEVTPLPVFGPDAGSQRLPIPASVAGSVECHVSSGRWCTAASKPFQSDERYERCKRLSADTAARTVELLNAWRGDHLGGPEELGPDTVGCLSCHTRETVRGAAFGSMECETCHRLGDSHPTSPGRR